MTAPDQPSKAVSTTQRIYDAVCELNALEQPATRETVAEITGLKLSIVDDRLGALVDDEKIRRILRGVYAPVVTYPPARNISKEILSDGMVMYEFSNEQGSITLKLTPREDRVLSSLNAGAGAQLVAIEANRQQSILLTSMAAEMERIKKENRALQEARRASHDSPQLSLLPGA